MLEVFVHAVMDDVFCHLFLEPLCALYPSPLWDMHRGVHILEKYIVNHRRHHETPDKERTPEKVSYDRSNSQRNQTHRNKKPMWNRNTLAVLGILKPLFTSVELVMIDVTLSLPNQHTDFPMFERPMNNPLQNGIKEDAGENGKNNNKKCSHGDMIPKMNRLQRF
jgi:hypothetical protein